MRERNKINRQDFTSGLAVNAYTNLSLLNEMLPLFMQDLDKCWWGPVQPNLLDEYIANHCSRGDVIVTQGTLDDIDNVSTIHVINERNECDVFDVTLRNCAYTCYKLGETHTFKSLHLLLETVMACYTFHFHRLVPCTDHHIVDTTTFPISEMAHQTIERPCSTLLWSKPLSSWRMSWAVTLDQVNIVLDRTFDGKTSAALLCDSEEVCSGYMFSVVTVQGKMLAVTFNRRYFEVLPYKNNVIFEDDDSDCHLYSRRLGVLLHMIKEEYNLSFRVEPKLS